MRGGHVVEYTDEHGVAREEVPYRDEEAFAM